MFKVERGLEERFWEKVDRRGDDECWLWTGSVDGYGYGMFRPYSRKTSAVRAHVMALRLSGVEVVGDQCGLHRCDNPPCCNPRHLFVGSKNDNMRDRNAKDRQAKGEGNGRHKLTEAEVLEARGAVEAGDLSIRGAARKFGVGYTTMRNAVNGHTWRHV